MRTLEACKPARFLVEAGDDLGSQRRPRFGDRGEEVVGSGAVSCSLEGLALEGTLGGLACGELDVGRGEQLAGAHDRVEVDVPSVISST